MSIKPSNDDNQVFYTLLHAVCGYSPFDPKLRDPEKNHALKAALGNFTSFIKSIQLIAINYQILRALQAYKENLIKEYEAFCDEYQHQKEYFQQIQQIQNLHATDQKIVKLIEPLIKAFSDLIDEVNTFYKRATVLNQQVKRFHQNTLSLENDLSTALTQNNRHDLYDFMPGKATAPLDVSVFVRDLINHVLQNNEAAFAQLRPDQPQLALRPSIQDSIQRHAKNRHGVTLKDKFFNHIPQVQGSLSFLNRCILLRAEHNGIINELSELNHAFNKTQQKAEDCCREMDNARGILRASDLKLELPDSSALMMPITQVQSLLAPRPLPESKKSLQETVSGKAPWPPRPKFGPPGSGNSASSGA